MEEKTSATESDPKLPSTNTIRGITVDEEDSSILTQPTHEFQEIANTGDNAAISPEEQPFIDNSITLDTETNAAPARNELESIDNPRNTNTVPDHDYLDHGWAWVILTSSVLFNLCQGLNQFVFAILYVELTEEFQSGKGSIGLISSAQSIASAITCLFSGVFIDSLGCRIMGVLSSALIVISYIVSFLSPYFPTLVAFFAVLGGIGLGFGKNVGLIVTQHWFDKRRALAGGVSQIGAVLGSMLCATIITWLIECYGWKGTMLLMAGIELHGIVFALLFRPPPQTTQRTEKTSLSQKMKETVNSLKDVSLFKHLNFYLLTTVWFLTSIGIFTFVSHLPGYCVHHGFTKEEGSIPLTVMIGVVPPMMIVVGLLGDKVWIDRVILMGFGMILGGLIVAFFPFATTFISVVILAPVYGIGYSCAATLRTTTIVDLMGLKLAAKAQAFVLTLYYMGTFIAVPFSGWIYDQTGSYNIPFPLAGSCQITAGLILIVLKIYRTKCKRDISTEEDVELQT